MKPYIRLCQENDITSLQQIGYETYDETFRSMNSEESMEAYLKEAFAVDRITAEQRTNGSEFYFPYAHEVLAGYLKLNTAPAQTDINDTDSLEIERIYVRNRFKGKGFGKMLISFAIDQALSMGLSYVWLGGWEQNLSAIAFYEKMGFRKWKTHSFRMGDELQSDLILKREGKAEPS